MCTFLEAKHMSHYSTSKEMSANCICCRCYLRNFLDVWQMPNRPWSSLEADHRVYQKRNKYHTPSERGTSIILLSYKPTSTREVLHPKYNRNNYYTPKYKAHKYYTCKYKRNKALYSQVFYPHA